MGMIIVSCPHMRELYIRFIPVPENSMTMITNSLICQEILL